MDNNHFAVICFSSDIDRHRAEEIRDQAQRSLLRLGWPSPGRLVKGGTELLYCGDRRSQLHDSDQEGASYSVTKACVSSARASVLSPQELFAEHKFRGTIDGLQLTAPFAVICIDGDGTVTAYSDPLGLQHLWVSAGAHWTVLSSSALWAGLIARARVNIDAALVRMRVGHCVPCLAPINNVTKVPPNGTFTIVRGIPHGAEPSCAVGEQHGALGVQDAVAHGAMVLKRAVSGLLHCFPQAALELSGGLDSRLVLSCLTKEDCRGRVAVTIGDSMSVDVQLARQIASMYGLTHVHSDLRVAKPHKWSELLHKARTISTKADHLRDPMFAYVLASVNALRQYGTRFTGQGGEVARGFYYLNPRCEPDIDAVSYERIIKYRIIANDSVDVRLLTPRARAASEELTRDAIRKQLTVAPGHSHDKLDSYYKFGRLQFGVGSAMSAASQERVILAPFFTTEYLQWSSSISCSARLGSRALCAILASLDATLAKVPLDGGMSPQDLLSEGVGSRVRRARIFAQKALAKLWQVVRRVERPPIGTLEVARILSRGIHDPEKVFPHAMASGVFDPIGVHRAFRANAVPVSTLSALMTLDWLIEDLG